MVHVVLIIKVVDIFLKFQSRMSPLTNTRILSFLCKFMRVCISGDSPEVM